MPRWGVIDLNLRKEQGSFKYRRKRISINQNTELVGCSELQWEQGGEKAGLIPHREESSKRGGQKTIVLREGAGRKTARARDRPPEEKHSMRKSRIRKRVSGTRRRGRYNGLWGGLSERPRPWGRAVSLGSRQRKKKSQKKVGGDEGVLGGEKGSLRKLYRPSGREVSWTTGKKRSKGRGFGQGGKVKGKKGKGWIHFRDDRGGRSRKGNEGTQYFLFAA